MNSYITIHLYLGLAIQCYYLKIILIISIIYLNIYRVLKSSLRYIDIYAYIYAIYIYIYIYIYYIYIYIYIYTIYSHYIFNSLPVIIIHTIGYESMIAIIMNLFIYYLLKYFNFR